jgi:hypothetical protein
MVADATWFSIPEPGIPKDDDRQQRTQTDRSHLETGPQAV